MPERDHKLTVLLAPQEMETLKEIAEEEGRSVSQTIREMIKAEARRRAAKASK